MTPAEALQLLFELADQVPLKGPDRRMVDEAFQTLRSSAGLAEPPTKTK